MSPPVTGQALVTDCVAESLGSRARAVNTSSTHQAGIRRLVQRSAAEARAIALTIVDRPNVVYRSVSAHDGARYDLILTAVCRLLGRRQVLHHHSTPQTRGPDRPHRALYRVAGRRAIHVVLSDRMARDLSRSTRKISPPIRVVSNLALFEFEMSRPLPRSSRADGRGGIRLGLLSNLRREKGVAEALEATNRLAASGRQVRLELAGPADTEVEALVAEAQASGTDVVLLGPMYGDAKAAFLRSLDVFLLPSHVEAEPLVVYEAIAAGTIPVVSDVGAVREQIPPDLQADLIVPVDEIVPALADAVARLCDRADQLDLVRRCQSHLLTRADEARLALQDLLRV